MSLLSNLIRYQTFRLRLYFSSNFIAECANGRDEQVCADCTFEQDTCQWLDVSVGPYAWMRDKAANVAQSHVGPVIDRTY
jgi:bifunctional N-acetylglucosamine-1-phosphate-uridyltransferase/glucosamine-1-phosphate-acetyltransferase GlmU-like protein